VRGRGNGKLVNIIILYRTYRREAWRLERIGMMDAVERLVYEGRGYRWYWDTLFRYFVSWGEGQAFNIEIYCST
jgi:hypothetical protein